MSWRPFLLAAVLALVGCDALTFSPDSEPFTDVDATPELLVLDLAPTDTVGLYGSARLAFTFPGRRADRVEVYLDDELVAEGGADGSVTIETRGRTDGPYSLRVLAFAPSGTGSLGDRVGRERIVTERKATAVIDNAPPEAVLASSRIHGGLLTLEWGRYRRYNFDGYTVERAAWNVSRGQYGNWEAVYQTDAAEVVAWADSAYLGGRVLYRVGLRARGEVVQGEAVEVNVAPPSVIAHEVVGEGRARVAWHPPVLSAGFDRYTIYRVRPYTPPEFVAELGGLRDTATVVAAEMALGQPARYELATESATPGPRAVSEFETYGDPASPFSGGEGHPGVVYVPGQEAVLGTEAVTGQPALYDPVTLRRLAVASLPEGPPVRAIAVSPSGRIAVIAAHGSGGGRLYELDPSTLAPLRSIDLTRVMGPEGIVDVEYGRVSLADDGVLVFGATEDEHSFLDIPDLFAVDLASGAVVASISRGDGSGPFFERRSPVARSKDGRYLISGSYGGHVLYERHADPADGFRYVGRLPSEIRRATFISSTEIAALTSGSGHGLDAKVYSVPSFELVRELGRGYAGLSRIKAAGDQVIVHDGDAGVHAVHVFASATGAPVASFDAMSEGYVSPDPEVSLAAGTLWHRGRYRRFP